MLWTRLDHGSFGSHLKERNQARTVAYADSRAGSVAKRAKSSNWIQGLRPYRVPSTFSEGTTWHSLSSPRSANHNHFLLSPPRPGHYPVERDFPTTARRYEVLGLFELPEGHRGVDGWIRRIFRGGGLVWRGWSLGLPNQSRIISKLHSEGAFVAVGVRLTWL